MLKTQKFLYVRLKVLHRNFTHKSKITYVIESIIMSLEYPIVTLEDVLNVYKSKIHGIDALQSHMNWFPVFATSILAGIVADLMCDGHLQKNRWRFDFTSRSKVELKYFGRRIYDLFGIKGKIRPCLTNKFGITFNYGVNCKPLSRVLCLCGAPRGCKVKNRFLIPDWIMNDKGCFREFIKRVFTCEGCVDIHGKFLILEMWKSEELIENGIKFMNQIRKGLSKYFNIKSSKVFISNSFNIRKDGIITRPLRFNIKSDSVKKFYDKIEFDNKEKQNKLRLIILGREEGR